GRALVDPFGKHAHFGDTPGNLLAQEHAAAARLGALADDDLDGIRAAQVVGVHAVARWQDLIDEQARVLPLLLRHAAVAGRRRGADCRGAAAQRLRGARRQRAEAHAGDGDRNLQRDRLPREAGADRDVGGAFLTIAFERVAADRGAEKQEVVEVRQPALGAAAADVVDAARR